MGICVNRIVASEVLPYLQIVGRIGLGIDTLLFCRGTSSFFSGMPFPVCRNLSYRSVLNAKMEKEYAFLSGRDNKKQHEREIS